MAAQEKKTGFVIKLSSETVQKLSEEEQQAKCLEAAASSSKTNTEPKEDDNAQSNKKKINKSIGTTSQDLAVLNKKSCKKIQPKSNLDDPTAKDTVEKPKDSNPDAPNASWGEYAPYITYEGEEAIYTDPTSQQKYTWSKDTNAWAAKPCEVNREYSYEDDTHVYTEPDGSKFFWDEEKKAWIPKVDDDFLAVYQMSYGFVDNTKKDDESGSSDAEKKVTKKEKPDPGLKRKAEAQWFDQSDENNTKVYVSNLPSDLTEEEFVELMQKCGLVERDLGSQKMKVKLYMDKEQKCFKGDALCTYIKIESVELALKLIDGMEYKGNKIKVERAQFQLKGEYNPALKPKKRKKKELEKLKKMQQKLFDWRPEKFAGERSKHERVVIVKNLFHPTDFDNEVQLILDYQQDLREECTKCGEVRKVVIFDRHPEGVAQITMKEPEQADAVITLINGRWFGKKQITAEIWDGRTKYRIAETDADINQRIDKWGRFLEGKEDKNKDVSSETASKELSSEPKTEENPSIIKNEIAEVNTEEASITCKDETLELEAAKPPTVEEPTTLME